MVEIRVQDNGCGIAQEYHEHVFARFFQLPRPEGGRGSGQGLGLTVVKEIVQLHGGRVGIESTPEMGCTVILILDALHQPRENDRNSL
jgi:signal transduction histidine kinase